MNVEFFLEELIHCRVQTEWKTWRTGRAKLVIYVETAGAFNEKINL
jgi:hypothetical protein